MSSPAAFRSTFPSGRRFWLAVLTAWTAVGAAETLKTGVYLGLQGTPRSLGDLILLNMPWWYLWAALTPVVVWLARRFPVGTGSGWRHLPVHLVAAGVLAIVHLAASGLVLYSAGLRGAFPDWSAQVQWLLNAYLTLDMLTYGCVVAIVTTLALVRRLRDEELRAARLETRAAQLEAGVTEARLRALERELDPHFLFNTLHTVSGLARQGDVERLHTMLARLAELLRRTMDRSRGHEVPLHDELDLLDQYLDIERVRLGERLSVDLRVDPDAADALVPTFMLQPLVENAIRHGIAATPLGGELQVHVRAAADTLTVLVRNVQHGAGADTSAWREGLGLRNTRARLEQLYGTAASLTIDHADARDVRVTVRLPWRPADRGAALPLATGATG